MFDWLKRNKESAAVSSEAIVDSNLDAALSAYLAATQKTLTRFDEVPSADVPYNAPELLPHVQQIVGLCREGDQVVLNYAIGRLSTGLAIPDPFQASRAAMLIGVLVERGGSPTLALPAVLARVSEFLTRARELFDIMQAENTDLDNLYEDNPALLSRYFDAFPENVKAVRGLPLLLRPVMTMLCRDVPARIAARQNVALVRAAADMEEIQSEAFYLSQVLQITDDAPFLVLHAHQKKGFRVRVTGVRNNFHLFTLLQGELIGPGKITGPISNTEVVSIARGEAPLTHDLNDSAAFGYFHYLGLQSDGTLDTVPGASWLWGEMSADTTPVWEGSHVVLLDKLPLGSRTWDSGFFAPLHDALRSHVTIEETLSPSDVDALMVRLTQASQEAARKRLTNPAASQNTPANDGGR